MKNHLTTFIPDLINAQIFEAIRYLDQMPFSEMVFIITAAMFLVMGVLYILIKKFCKSEIDLEGVCMANELNAAVYGLIIALILVALFNAGKKTDESISNEAMSLLFLVRDSKNFNNSDDIKAAAKNYTDIVLEKQWGLMCEGKVEEAKKLTSKAMAPLYKAVQQAQPNGIVQTSFYTALPDILYDLNTNQQNRLKMAGNLIPIQFWRIINCMTILVLLFLVYGNFWGRSLFPVVVSSCVIALSFSLLIAFHYPFLGPSAVSNDALAQIQNYLSSSGQLSHLPSQPIIPMSLYDSFNQTILKTIFFLSGTSFHNMIFILFGITFILLAIFIWVMHRFRKSDEISDGTSLANTTSASVYGLILAFFVVALYDQNQETKDSIAQEVGYLTAISKNAQVLDNASQIQDAVKGYIKVVLEDQWPLLCSGDIDQVTQAAMTSLDPLYKAIRESKPQGAVQEKFYASFPKLLHQLEEAQRTRIMDADLHLPIQFWRTIVLMTFLTFALLVYANPWKGPGTLIPILIPSIVIVFCLGLLITFHYPFIGPFKISPDDYRHIDFETTNVSELNVTPH